MSAPVFQMNFVQDIKRPIMIQHCGNFVFTGDNLSDTVSVSVLEDGEPYAISGTVAMNCIRADGATVTVTGSISGNTASATLTQACVAIPGPLAVVMKVSSDTTTTTLLKAVYMVDVGVTGTAVDPGTIIPDVTTLINAIETAVGSIPADYSDLLTAIAPSFNPEASTPYPAGSYVWYPGLSNDSGALYKFTTAHSGSWTGTDVELTSIGKDLANAKDDIIDELGGLMLTTDIKVALLNCFDNVAWSNANGNTYVSALEALLSNEAVTYITATFNQSMNVYTDSNLQELRKGLTVTAHFLNGSSTNVVAYALSGTLAAGTSTIMVTYKEHTTTFNVTVLGIGSMNYASALSQWLIGAYTSATYADGVITFAGATQQEVDGYSNYILDCKNTLWSTLENKKLRIRFTLESPDWVGEKSTTAPLNNVNTGIAIYQNASIEGGGGRQKWKTLESLTLSAEPKTYEYLFEASLANFTSGTGTPTSVSTVGALVYVNTVNTVIVSNVEIVEVLE